jgi:hypothetical protein
MSNQPVVVENQTKTFYTVVINEKLFVCRFKADENSVKISDGKSAYVGVKKPVEFSKLETAKKAAGLCGGTIRKHTIHLLATETIEEVNANE